MGVGREDVKGLPRVKHRAEHPKKSSQMPQKVLRHLTSNRLSAPGMPCGGVIPRELVAQAIGLMAHWSTCKGCAELRPVPMSLR